MNNEIMVSVICNTYNHEKYIRDALEGFVMQKTNFAFEVLVHDDASTDGTADIVREYEKKYPDIIKPIYQKENQYSQKIPISRTFNYPRAKGKYAALCEGDDYWTDPLKLQKQFDLLESNPNINMCAHTARYERNGKLAEFFMPSKTDCLFTTEDIICGGGGFVATNSLFFRMEIGTNVPKFREMLFLDYTLQISGSLKGGMLYLADCMSVYRAGTESSWTKRMMENPKSFVKHYHEVDNSLTQLDIDTSYKYKKAVKKAKNKNNKLMLHTVYWSKIKPDDEENLWIKEIALSTKLILKVHYFLHLVKQTIKRIIKR